MQELHYHSVKPYTTTSISRVAHFCVTETCDLAKIYYNPPVHFKHSKRFDCISHWGFLTGHKFRLCRSSVREQCEQGCAVSGDEPGATGNPAQAVPSPTGCSPAGSEHGADPGSHCKESHQQPQSRQRNEPVPSSIQQTRAKRRTGDRTTTWVCPEGKVRDRHGHSIAQARTGC